MHSLGYKQLSRERISTFLIILTLCFFIIDPIFPAFAASSVPDKDVGWIEVRAEISEALKTANIRYIWVTLSKQGVDHVIELLPANDFYYKNALETGEYTVGQISVVADMEPDYTANRPDNVLIVQKQMAQLEVELEESELASPPASTNIQTNSNIKEAETKSSAPAESSQITDLIVQAISEPFSGLLTAIIFFILCIFMLYLKFRKETSNND